MPRFFVAGLYLCALVLGFVLMGFEMLGSRYLNPYFGSGIATWAALISTVLGALMVGYFVGGSLVDRHPSAALCGWLVIGSAVYLSLLPLFADPAIEGIIATVGDGAGGVICAAIALLLVPLALLGTFSPFGVRLLLRDAGHAGRVTGLVYSVSTIGNVIGTLATTFILIPSYGTRHITTVFAAIVALCGIFLVLLDVRARAQARATLDA